jgi:hypothetical protein
MLREQLSGVFARDRHGGPEHQRYFFFWCFLGLGPPDWTIAIEVPAA